MTGPFLLGVAAVVLPLLVSLLVAYRRDRILTEREEELRKNTPKPRRPYGMRREGNCWLCNVVFTDSNKSSSHIGCFCDKCARELSKAGFRNAAK